MSYAIAKLPTPIFNTEKSPFSAKPLALDAQKRIMALETIAFPGTKFSVKKELGTGIWQVETSEYPSEDPIYVDRRFLQSMEEEPAERARVLPGIAAICQKMKSLLGMRYFWGGSWPEGIPEMFDLYDQSEISLDAACRGVDCSGLLYWAANGCTPRNTGAMTAIGQNIDISAMPAEAVQKLAEPLDIMVWRGHVVIVLDSDTVIESRIGDGVFTSPFCQRLEEVRKLTKEREKQLFYRRWHPEILD